VGEAGVGGSERRVSSAGRNFDDDCSGVAETEGAKINYREPDADAARGLMRSISAP